MYWVHSSSEVRRRPKCRRSCAARALARSPPPPSESPLARCAGARMVGLGWWDGMGGAGGGSTAGANAGCAGGGGGGGWHIGHAHAASQLDARSTYVYPQAVEEVSMPGSNQADADAVFDAAATKVQAVLRGSSARKKSATKKADGEVCWRTDGGLGVVGWDGRCGWRQHGWSQCPNRRRRKVR